MNTDRFTRRGPALVAAAAVLAASSVTAQARFSELGIYDLPRQPGAATDGMAVVDVDHDGHVDVISIRAAAIGTGRTLFWLKNDGQGHLRSAAETLLDGFPVVRIATGDVDGDGDDDCLLGCATNTGSITFKVMKFDAMLGQFVESSRFFTDARNDIDVADVDGDGDLDFLAVGISETVLWRNDGNGAFTGTADPLPGVVRAVAAGFADLDGDGDPDCIVTQASGQPPLAFRNDGGTFTAVASALPATASGGVEFADVDGDGDLDVHLAGAALVENLGNMQFVDATASRAPGLIPTLAAAFADADGDGDVDLLLLASDVEVARFLNDGSGHFARAANVAPSRQTYNRLRVADVDNDGDQDLFLHAPAGQDQLLLNDANGAFHNATRGGLFHRIANGFANNTAITAQVAFDFDRDGDVDLFLASWRFLRAYRNDGWGTFTEDTLGIMPWLNVPNTTALLPFDMDGDGDLDLLQPLYGHGVAVNRNDGGRFSDQSGLFPPLSDDTLTAVSGDVDGDGDIDVVLGNDGQDRVFLNDGTGRFSENPALPTDSSLTSMLVLVDVDGDRDLDLFRGTPTGVQLLLNSGGLFIDVSSTHLPALVAEVLCGTALDADGDGDADLAFGGIGTLKLYRNDGTGHFTDESFRLPSLGTGDATALLAFDSDDDGDDDLVLGKAWRNVAGTYTPVLNRFFRNDGGANFVREFTYLPDEEGITRTLLAADVDRDGDRDIVVGENYNDETRLLLNLRLHTHVARLPRPGAPLQIDITLHPGASQPGDAAALRLAFREAAIPLPPFGTYGLDPSATFFFPPLPVPAPAGELSISLPLPPLPELRGTRWFAQSFLVIGADPSAWRLTQREAFTIH